MIILIQIAYYIKVNDSLMSIEELTTMETQFSRYLQSIKGYSQNLPKSTKLRIGAWLKKLCSVVDNVFWRRNRNLYAEVLALMLGQGSLEYPFDKAPPEGSLPKLNLYEIPFKIRKQLSQEKRQEEKDDKQNEDSQNRKRSEIAECRYRKKHSSKFDVMKSIPEPSNSQIQFQIETRRKKNSHKSSTLIETLESTLKFLAKNHQILGQDQAYREIIKETVLVADQLGHDFRQMKFSFICPQ